MELQPLSFDFESAVAYWAVIFIMGLIVFGLVGFVLSLLFYGTSGPRRMVSTVMRGARDLCLVSGRRIWALSVLTFREALSRKAFTIGFIFLTLFMFGGWFLAKTDIEKPARPYITFVMSSMYFLLNLMAILIACWGLPADIKAKSLHTVVTKPVRRSEIVMGRMTGYSLVVLLVLVVTSIFGYVWIQRQVPERARDQLVARVPVYGDIQFLDRNGEPTNKMVNVGDIWQYRSFIEGQTQARAVWTFKDLDVESMRQEGQIRLEQTFEAFRTYKGEIDEQTRYNVSLVNPETDLHVLIDTYPVEEFSVNPEASVITIPATVTEDTYDIDAEPKKYNVFDDLIHDETLVVEIGCVDQQQYIGCAQRDLFVRMPDRSFLTSYVKSTIGLGLMLILVVAIGTTSSCFLKGPVSTLLTGSLIILGNFLYQMMREMLVQKTQQGRVLGGGLFESVYRLVTGMNPQTPIPANTGTDIIKTLDEGIFSGLFVVNAIVPNFNYFNMNTYTANGFDVPWNNAMLPSLLITIGFLIPLIILGYFSLQLRELESK